MRRSRNRYMLFFIVGVVIITALIWIRVQLLDKLGMELKNRIQSTNFNGFQIKYDSMRIDWLEKAIDIDNLTLSRAVPDSTCLLPEHIFVGNIRAEGIGLTRLILKKTLSVDAIRFDTLRVVLNQASQLLPDSAAEGDSEFKLLADVIDIRHIDLLYADSASCDTIVAARSHLLVRSLNVDFSADKPLLHTFSSIRLDSVDITSPADFYSFRALRAEWDATKNLFRADSIRVIPAYGRLEFGRRRGNEVDRFECSVPSLLASGLSVSVPDSLNLKVALMEVQFQIKIFRDKRYPFVIREKLLPMTLIQRLPFRLTMDSVKVSDSFVQYEEFAAGTSEPGGIFFADLNAVVGNISNTAGDATLRARAKLFGQGDVNVYVTFPSDPSRRSSLKGSIRNFHLPKLNAILTPSTQLSVESGQMNALLFEFTFNEFRSDGQLELNYENLKLATFKDPASSEEREIDNFKTFMINTFVFRKNMTKDLPEEKRTGTIDFERDRSRSIFNLWSKSLVSGIKSAYNLDKASKDDKPEVKNDDQPSRRELRRQKRLARKREKNS